MLWTTHIYGVVGSIISWHFGEMDKTLSNNSSKVFKDVDINSPGKTGYGWTVYTLWSNNSRGSLE